MAASDAGFKEPSLHLMMQTVLGTYVNRRVAVCTLQRGAALADGQSPIKLEPYFKASPIEAFRTLKVFIPFW